MMCIFCKIIENAIPSYKLYEDEHVLAILDISQATVGHTLVILKKHVETIFDLKESDAKKVFAVTTKLAKKIKKALNVDNLNIINNNGPIAGQTVHHFHIHLVPRTKDDGLTIHYPTNKRTPDEFQSLRNIITGA
jgi:histidine triad (HIT) family protein